MATGYWSQTRANGKPLDPGMVCWVSEAEGRNPVYIYGKDESEIITKLTRTNAFAEAALVRARAAAAMPAAPGRPAESPARRRLTADEVMQQTANLTIPGKSGDAMTRLIEDATGIDLNKLALQNFAALAMRWQGEHPEFAPHPGNKELLAALAQRMAGGRIGDVTEPILTQAFIQLQQRGVLFEQTEDPEEAPSNLKPFPGGSPVQRVERDRGARLFATGTRTTAFRGGNTPQPKTPKYSAEDVRKMPLSKQKELIEKNDPDYAAACEAFYGRHASA